jgi:hypothetical protein
MIADQLLRLASSQSLAGVENGVVNTDVIDLDVVRNAGVGETLYVRIRIDSTYTQSPAGGTNIVLLYCEGPTFTGGITIAQLPLNNSAIPAAGTVYYIPIPPVSKQRLEIPGTGAKKYLGVQWQIYGAGTVVTGGSWTVDIVTEVNMVEQDYGKDATFKVV